MPRTRTPAVARVLVALAAIAILLAVGGPTAGAQSTTTAPDDAAATTPTLNSTIPGSTAEVTVTTDHHYYDGSATYDAYLPTGGSSPRPALILVHGGGWKGGDQSELAPYAMDAAANHGWAAFTVNYRLDGDDPHAWADELHDIQAAVRHIVATRGAEYGIDRDQVVLLGDSAGANLVALVSAVGTADPVTGTPVGDQPDLAVPIKAVALWSPPTDLAPLAQTVPGQPPAGCGDDPACDFTWSSSAMADYLGCQPADCPDRYREASPITHVSSSTAPSYISNSTDELVPLDQVKAYETELDEAGVDVQLDVVDGDLHAAQLGPQVWPASVSFLSAHLDGPAHDASPGTGGGSGQWLLLGGAVVLLVAAIAVAVAVVEHRRHPSTRT